MDSEPAPRADHHHSASTFNGGQTYEPARGAEAAGSSWTEPLVAARALPARNAGDVDARHRGGSADRVRRPHHPRCEGERSDLEVQDRGVRNGVGARRHEVTASWFPDQRPTLREVGLRLVVLDRAAGLAAPAGVGARADGSNARADSGRGRAAGPVHAADSLAAAVQRGAAVDQAHDALKQRWQGVSEALLPEREELRARG